MSGKMKRILISPPFSLYIPNTPISTSIRGTFTIRPRLPIYPQVFKTCRLVKGGWVNSMGFRNRGIESEIGRLREDNERVLDKYIWSIGVVESRNEWEELYSFLEPYRNIDLELNLGCKNVRSIGIHPDILEKFLNTFRTIIIKLPCNISEAKKIVNIAYTTGVRYFHSANTFKTDIGSESSRRIQYESLPICKYIKDIYPDCTIIGGGGIYSSEDISKYKKVGATHFSLATGLLKPWNLIGIYNAIKI